MDTQLIKNLLNHDFWSQHKERLLASLFSDDVAEIYEVIHDYHTKYDTDIPASALPAMWKDKNPVSTRAEMSVIEGLATAIAEHEDLPAPLAGELIEGLWKREIGRKIGALGLNIAEGKSEAYEKLVELMDRISKGFLPDDFPDPITDDLDVLLSELDDSKKIPFNIRQLREKVNGIGPSDFVVVFARPETGKTAFLVSLMVGPGGFCEKGAKVLYLGNEEDPTKTMLRSYMCFGGYTKEQISKNVKAAKDTFSIIKGKIIMQNIQDWDLNRVEAYIKKMKPDIVVIDQLDKVDISGKYEKSTDKLREIYTRTRALAGKYKIGIIGVSQASADAENKTILTADMMENSKTGKYAEADLIMGIGKYPDNPDGTKDPIRFITVSKNKLTGWHGTLTCKLNSDISRYED